MTITSSSPIKPAITAAQDAFDDLVETAPSRSPADVSSFQQMSISIDSLPDAENRTGSANNINSSTVTTVTTVSKADNVSNPFDSDSGSDTDWQKGPATPGSESDGSGDADESGTITQEPPQSDSWASRAESHYESHTESISSGAAGHRFVHEALFPAPLNPSPTLSMAMRAPYRFEPAPVQDHASEFVRGHDDGSRDRPASAFDISLPSDRAPTPYRSHRESYAESPRQHTPLRVTPRAAAPYPNEAMPNPFAINRSHPDETAPLYSPRMASTNPFASKPLARRPESYYDCYGTTLQLPSGPVPLSAVYRQPTPPPPPPSEHMYGWHLGGMNDDDEHAPGAAYGSRAEAHASSGETLTQEHIENQRQLQKFVGLLSELLHGEVRNVVKTVLDLTNDLYDMRQDIASLRRDMESLREEQQMSAASDRADSSNSDSRGSGSGSGIPMRPFATHYYPDAFNGNDTHSTQPGHFRIPIFGSNHTARATDDKTYNDDHDSHTGHDSRNGHNHYNFYNPHDIHDSHLGYYNRGDGDSETLPPYTYNHDTRAPLHPVMKAFIRDEGDDRDRFDYD